jgi:hypothetical protein
MGGRGGGSRPANGPLTVVMNSAECKRARNYGPVLQRRRADSNRRIEVLQTSALPLGYGA